MFKLRKAHDSILCRSGRCRRQIYALQGLFKRKGKLHLDFPVTICLRIISIVLIFLCDLTKDWEDPLLTGEGESPGPGYAEGANTFPEVRHMYFVVLLIVLMYLSACSVLLDEGCGGSPTRG